jgi:hypothetical protein
MKQFIGCCLFCLVYTQSAIAQSPWLPDAEQKHLTALLPKNVRTGPNLRFYKATDTNQGLLPGSAPKLLTKFQDTIDPRDGARVFNPNRFNPYAVPGGLADVVGYGNRFAVSIPEGKKIKLFSNKVFSPALNTKATRIEWEFPEGTMFLDMLFTDNGVFEVRRRERVAGVWVNTVPFRGDNVPRGYKGLAREVCADCHRDAGNVTGYSMGLRGSDTVWSFWPFVEGTIKRNPAIPTEG